MAVQDGGMERSWTQALPPAPGTQRMPAAHGTMSSEKNCRLAELLLHKPGESAMWDGGERWGCGLIRAPPLVVTRNSDGSHRFELLPEKRFVLHARHPYPWTSIRERGLLMPAENHWGLCPRPQRAVEDCISPFKGLAVVSVTPGLSTQDTPSDWRIFIC